MHLSFGTGITLRHLSSSTISIFLAILSSLVPNRYIQQLSYEYEVGLEKDEF